MNRSEFPFDPKTISQKIGEGSFVKETYLNKDRGIIVKGYERKHLEDINNNLKLLHRSNTNIKNFVPEAVVILGRNEDGVEMAYLAMGYIDGTEIAKKKELSEEQRNLLDTFLLSCFQFAEETGQFPDILDAYTGDKETVFTNIVAGTTKKDNIQGIYFVDIWPNKSVEWIGISSFANGVVSAINNIEVQTGQDMCPITKAYLQERFK